MSAFKGTPGPWEANWGKGITGPTAAWAMKITGNPKTQLVTAANIPDGDVMLSSVVALTPNRADARLIAAAPELLAALQEVMPDGTRIRNWDDETAKAWLAKATAAIAKALGDE